MRNYVVRLHSNDAKDWRTYQRNICQESGVELLPEGNPVTMWVRADQEHAKILANHPSVDFLMESTSQD